MLRSKSLTLLLLLLLLQMLLVKAMEAELDLSEISLKQVMQLYGNGTVMTSDGLKRMIDFGRNATRYRFINEISDNSKRFQQDNYTCSRVSNSILNSTNSTPINETQLRELLPMIVFAMQNPDCFYAGKGFDETDNSAWLYSVLAVAVMKVAALSGIVTFPCMSARVYSMALSFLVPLAISSLMGSTLFIFLPDALSLPDIPHYNENFGNPILKLASVGGGIYAFYLIEKLLRLVMEYREKKLKTEGRLRQNTYSLEIVMDTAKADEMPRRKISTTMAGDISSFPSQRVLTKRDSRVDDLSPNDHERVQRAAAKAEDGEGEAKAPVPPIAWIALMGDCIRNFIDGTAIGAAFSFNLFTGLSLTVAFIFEEIPTELGDVAILLNAGMSLCRATMLHFAAATFAFVGAAVGILLGDLGSSQLWIFSVSAGAFLYIALVDLMPEMNHALDSDKSREIGRLKIFLLQNAGLLLGFAATGLLGYYAESLHIDFGDGSGGGHGH